MSRQPDTPEQKAAKKAERDEFLNPRKTRTMNNTEQNSDQNPAEQNPGAAGAENSPGSAATGTDTSGADSNNPGAAELAASGSATPEKSYNPFQSARVNRGYSRPKIDQSLTQEIPEVVAEIEQPGAQKPPSTPPGQATSNAATQAGIGDQQNQMSPAEKTEAATLLADAALETYEKGHYFGREFVKVNPDELKEMHMKGELDMNARMFENPDDPEGEGETVLAYFTDVNQQIDQAITVDPEFKAKVRPPMIRLFEKMGWGLSDGTYLLFMFGQDIASKTGAIIAFKKAQNRMLEQIKEGHTQVQKRVEDAVQGRLAVEIERIEAEIRKKYEDMQTQNLKSNGESKKEIVPADKDGTASEAKAENV